MTREHTADEVRSIDMELGGDDDMPGIAQELIVDDIDDIAFDTNLSTDDRRTQLMQLLQDTRERSSTDRMGDMRQIRSHLKDRIASLSNPMESQTLAESTGMDADSRSDDDDPADHVDDEDEEARLQDLMPKQI